MILYAVLATVLLLFSAYCGTEAFQPGSSKSRTILLFAAFLAASNGYGRALDYGVQEKKKVDTLEFIRKLKEPKTKELPADLRHVRQWNYCTTRQTSYRCEGYEGGVGKLAGRD